MLDDNAKCLVIEGLLQLSRRRSSLMDESQLAYFACAEQDYAELDLGT